MDQFTVLIDSAFYATLVSLGFLIVSTVEGFFEALVAYLFGDPTPREDGFLTLNPAAHCNPAGFMMLIAIMTFIGLVIPPEFAQSTYFALLVLFGMQLFYKVTVNPLYFKHFRLGIVMTSLAAPLGCFVVGLAVLYAFVYIPWQSLGDAEHMVRLSLQFIYRIALWFGVLALIPLPPFRGWNLAKMLLPASLHEYVVWLEQYSIYILLLFFGIPFISDILLHCIDLVVLVISQVLHYLVF